MYPLLCSGLHLEIDSNSPKVNPCRSITFLQRRTRNKPGVLSGMNKWITTSVLFAPRWSLERWKKASSSPALSQICQSFSSLTCLSFLHSCFLTVLRVHADDDDLRASAGWPPGRSKRPCPMIIKPFLWFLCESLKPFKAGKTPAISPTQQ